MESGEASPRCDEPPLDVRACGVEQDRRRVLSPQEAADGAQVRDQAAARPRRIGDAARRSAARCARARGGTGWLRSRGTPARCPRATRTTAAWRAARGCERRRRDGATRSARAGARRGRRAEATRGRPKRHRPLTSTTSPSPRLNARISYAVRPRLSVSPATFQSGATLPGIERPAPLARMRSSRPIARDVDDAIAQVRAGVPWCAGFGDPTSSSSSSRRRHRPSFAGPSGGCNVRAHVERLQQRIVPPTPRHPR